MDDRSDTQSKQVDGVDIREDNRVSIVRGTEVQLGEGEPPL